MFFNERKQQEFENLKQAVLVLEKKVIELENPFLFDVGDKVKVNTPYEYNGMIGQVVKREFIVHRIGFSKQYYVFFDTRKELCSFAEFELEKVKQ